MSRILETENKRKDAVRFAKNPSIFTKHGVKDITCFRVRRYQPWFIVKESYYVVVEGRHKVWPFDTLPNHKYKVIYTAR